MFKLATISIVAFLFFGGGTEDKLRLKLHKQKKNVEIEITHAPDSRARWIYISGNSEFFTTGSLIQSEGAACAVLHRVIWRDVPQGGILEVEVNVRDDQNKVIETAFGKILYSVEGS